MQAKQVAAETPSEPPAPELLELGVSPIERRSSRRSRRRPASATSAHIATSTPDHAPSQPARPVALPEEQALHVSFDLGRSADASTCLFDATMASGQESHMSSPPRRRRRHADSPELSVQKVRRTYSRGDRSATVQVKLFEDLAVPGQVEENEENFFELDEEPQVKKSRAHKPKAHKAHKENDKEFDEWADKMAAEFEEIEKFELCYD
ncbi:hypothetical protein MTO96_027808 [Rhipicephalus appendiculatus]